MQSALFVAVATARIDLDSWTCDWACDAFVALMRDATADPGGAAAVVRPPCAPGALFKGRGWSFELHEDDIDSPGHARHDEGAEVVAALAEPAVLRAAVVGFSRDVGQCLLRARAPEAGFAAAGAGDDVRHFSARLCKTSASKAVLMLTDVTAIVARHARALARATERAKYDAARTCEARSRTSSFVFHEIGNLSTGLFGVLDQCREAATRRQPPSREDLGLFDTLLQSMRDVLQNSTGFARLSSANVNPPSEVRRARVASVAQT